MNQESATQLDKILALADSDHDGEAMGAIRRARKMLEREGLTFGDLARTAHRARFTLSLPFFTGSQVVQLEGQLASLQRDLARMQDDKESQQAQIEFWRRRAMDLEQQVGLGQAEAQRWRQMAREAIEKMWDMGQKAKASEFLSEDPAMDDVPLRVVGGAR